VISNTPAAYASLSPAARETQLSGVRPCAGARIMTNSMARATSWWDTVRNVRQIANPQSRPSKASHLSLTFPLGLNSVENFVGNLKFVSQMKRITVEKKTAQKNPPVALKRAAALRNAAARGYVCCIRFWPGGILHNFRNKKTKKKQKMIGWYPKPAFEDGF
jgi:hypothetical protein